MGVKKPHENQKAKALWKMKAAKDRGEDFYDPERKENILGRNKTLLELWEEHLKDPMASSFFFLTQKEPATMPGCENFSSFFNADIRKSLFSA